MTKHLFDNTIQKTFQWIHDLMALVNFTNDEQAYIALKGTLQALRDRLPIDDAVNFSAQLPMLVRGFYFEGWKPESTPIKVKTTEDFLDLVSSHLSHSKGLLEMDIEKIVRSVFQVIANHIPEGEIEHIKRIIPSQIATLWPIMQPAQYSRFI